MMMRHVLLFPALLLEASRIKFLAAERQETVIAAASNPDEPGLRLFEQRHILPHVLAPDFTAALRALLAEREIGHIYCPHDRCHGVLQDILERFNPDGVTLSNGLTQFYPDLVHDALRAAIAPIHADFAKHAMRRPLLPLDHMTAFLNMAALAAGQSHAEKLAAIGAIAADVPEGDWVEIGVASGRSAMFLAMLLHHFDCGKLIAIDPWTNHDIIQNINDLDNTNLVDNSVWERGIRVCRINLLPFAQGRVGLLRMTSKEAFALYGGQRLLGTPPFGPVAATGQIGLLHIDGNHDLPKVTEDMALWGNRLAQGAWMVVDDYIWDYGNGPQQAADAWVEAHRQDIAETFVAGRAMFVKMRE